MITKKNYITIHLAMHIKVLFLEKAIALPNRFGMREFFSARLQHKVKFIVLKFRESKRKRFSPYRIFSMEFIHSHLTYDFQNT